MKRIRRKPIKFSKEALQNAGYTVEVQKEYGTRYYRVISPQGKTVLEIVKRPSGALIVMGKGEKNYCYCKYVRLSIESGKAVAICEYMAAFNVFISMKIRE